MVSEITSGSPASRKESASDLLAVRGRAVGKGVDLPVVAFVVGRAAGASERTKVPRPTLAVT